MVVLVCHRQRALVAFAKLQAERQGHQVHTVGKSRDVVRVAREVHPQLIVLGHDLKDPDAEELKGQLNLEPSLRGVQVIVAKGATPDLLGKLKEFKWPGSRGAA